MSKLSTLLTELSRYQEAAYKARPSGGAEFDPMGDPEVDVRHRSETPGPHSSNPEIHKAWNTGSKHDPNQQNELHPDLNPQRAHEAEQLLKDARAATHRALNAYDSPNDPQAPDQFHKAIEALLGDKPLGVVGALVEYVTLWGKELNISPEMLTTVWWDIRDLGLATVEYIKDGARARVETFASYSGAERGVFHVDIHLLFEQIELLNTDAPSFRKIESIFQRVASMLQNLALGGTNVQGTEREIEQFEDARTQLEYASEEIRRLAIYVREMQQEFSER